jgi:uncharacterized membrane protein YwzB
MMSYGLRGTRKSGNQGDNETLVIYCCAWWSLQTPRLEFSRDLKDFVALQSKELKLFLKKTSECEKTLKLYTHHLRHRFDSAPGDVDFTL